MAACLSWEPIPARFSGSWQVDVTHVAEDYGEDRRPSENLTIALAAYGECTETTPSPASSHLHDVGAWRIDFTGCAAYRTRITGYVAVSVPVKDTDTATAFWEITGSHYLLWRAGRGRRTTRGNSITTSLSPRSTRYMK
jgi:hypothetical protein